METNKTKDARTLSFIMADGSGFFFWENWEGEIPQIGDKVLHLPLDADDDDDDVCAQAYRVIDRWTYNRQPGQVRYLVERTDGPWINLGDIFLHDVMGGLTDADIRRAVKESREHITKMAAG